MFLWLSFILDIIFPLTQTKSMSFVNTFPVYPNKWMFYMAPFIKDRPELLKFNWFLCARPFRDEKNNYVVDVGRYTSFFDKSTGKTYHVKFDATEKEPCLLLIASDPRNKSLYSELNLLCHDNKQELSLTCSLRKNIDKAYNLSKRLGYCGVAAKVVASKDSCKCDIVCNEVQFLFNRNVVEESKKCPYIDYAKSHETHLRENIKDFPSVDFIKNAKPGKDSLILRTILSPYLSS